jgi:hypothetical protein
MTNTAKVTKALRTAGYSVTTDMPNTIKVKKTRFQEETHVTVRYNMVANWNSTINWKTKLEDVTSKLVELGFDAVITENNGIQVSFTN